MMQYILMQEEYDALVNQRKVGIDMEKRKLQKLCTEIAVAMPVEVNWRDSAQPWGCILDENNDPMYCDHCPVQDICPNERKEWSQ